MKEIAKVACRITAIFMGVRFLSFLPALGSWFSSGSLGPGTIEVQFIAALIGSVAVILAYLLAAIFLWVFAEGIAEKMIGESGEVEQIVRIEAKEVQAAAYPIVGLVVLAISVPSLVRLISEYVVFSLRSSSVLYENTTMRNFAPEVIGVSVQVAIGLFLFLGPKAIIRILKKTREYGRENTAPDSDLEE